MAPPTVKDEVRHSASPDIESLVYDAAHEVRLVAVTTACEREREREKVVLDLAAQPIATKAIWTGSVGAGVLKAARPWPVRSALLVLARMALSMAGR